MLDLALNAEGKSVMLKDIAKRQEVSEKYLSQLVMPLKSAGFVTSIRGAHGGYLLAKNLEDITLKGIVDAVEGDTAILDCVREKRNCKRAESCTMRDVWCRLDDTITSFLAGITLKTLADDAKRNDKARVTRFHAMAF